MGRKKDQPPPTTTGPTEVPPFDPGDFMREPADGWLADDAWPLRVGAQLYVRKYPPVVAAGESLYAAAERIAVGWLHAEPPTG